LLAILFGIAAAWIPATAAAATTKLTPDSYGVIHACYGPADLYELHIVAVHTRCHDNESPLSWNQLGRRGPSGSGHTAIENVIFTFSAKGEGSSSVHSPNDSLWSWIGEAVPALGNALLLFGLGMLALSIALIPFGWLLAVPFRWPGVWRTPLFRWFGPALQIQAFEDSALEPTKLGTVFALLTQARVGGGREGGQHLYLVTGEGSPGPALAELQMTPQTQPLAVALSLLKLTWRRRRLIVTGSLAPADDHGTAAVALTLRRNSKFIGNSEFWPLEQPSPDMTPTTSNRVLAVAAAGWIEHRVVDETPGPQARDIFLSHDPRSWALFRAGAELSRISFLEEAADHYERALAIDAENIGALVDLAHLRRRGEDFEGAEALAYSAIDLIKARTERFRCARTFKRIRRSTLRQEDDPIWYRARIVLATVRAEWAKDLEAKAEDPGSRRKDAYDCAVTVARAAMDMRDWLESLVGRDELKAAAEGARISYRRRATLMLRARLEGRSFRLAPAVELYTLLGSTFEPGALLLVAANGERAEAPTKEPDRTIRYSVHNGRREPIGHRAELARDDVKKALAEELAGVGEADPSVLIRYIRTSRLKSPRVVYNLACYYTLAVDKEPVNRKEYLEIAAEYLRQSISRSPPRERRGLLDHAECDTDLTLLHEEKPDLLAKLKKLIPKEPE
jgi:hypothetical protein